MVAAPPYDNVNVCEEHGVMAHSSTTRRRCPLCNIDFDVDVVRDKSLPGDELSPPELRQRIDGETMEELLQLLNPYLSEHGESMSLYVVGLDGELPAGYSDAQERWVNAVVYSWDLHERAIVTETEAEETIASLREHGYGEEENSE